MEVIRERLNLQNSFSKEKEPIYINFRNHTNLWKILSFIFLVIFISAQLNTIRLNFPFNYSDLISIINITCEDIFIYYNLFPQIVIFIL